MTIEAALRGRVDGELRAMEPLAPWTSVRVGGPAEAWFRPASLASLETCLRICAAEQTPVAVLGGGANTLVGDGGVPGLTLKLPADLFPEDVKLSDDEGLLTFGAGAAIARLIQRMRSSALTGAEALAGIPGTLGGAVTMNAGTKNGECMAVVEAVELCTPAGTGWVNRADLPYGYRHTALPTGAVVTRVRFRLPRGDLAASTRAMDEDLSYRKRTQPLSQPNFGSVFKNPEGDNAGRLIELVGLKGYTIGRAQVSTLHANWIVNLGGAQAKDIVALMDLCASRVREELGVTLMPEVKRVGRFE